jgi:hypothetical protein
MPVNLLTVSEYARHRGCDEKAVRKALAERRITRLSEDRRCIDPTVADIQWAANTRARADSTGPAAQPAAPAAAAPAPGAEAPPAPAAPESDYSAARARRERAEATSAEVRAARDLALVVLRDGVERALFDFARHLRDAVMQSARDAAPKVRGMEEVRQIQLTLEEHARSALADVDTKLGQLVAGLVEEAQR